MSKEQCDKFSGAGVLVIEVPEHGRQGRAGELQLVLFRDKAKRSYADAGGKCEHVKHNNDPLKTAMEELYEESGALLRVDESYLTGYVEKTVGKHNRKWYRGYLLFTQQIRDRDYLDNIERLRHSDAPEYMQETDDIVHLPLSDVYRVVMVDHPSRARPYVVLGNGEEIRLHRRVTELLRVVFEGNPEWILKVMSESRFGRYRRKKDKTTGLVHYIYD